MLANASVVNANSSVNNDLYRALKGGQGNFGIITRFDFTTYSQGDFWNGRLVHNISDRNAIFAAFQQFTDESDPDAAVLSSFSTSNKSSWVAANSFYYAKPVIGNSHPQSYSPFYAIPAISMTNVTANLTTLVDNDSDSLGPKGYRWTQATALYKNNATIMARFFDLVNTTALRLPDDPALNFQIVYQPLTVHTAKQSELTGGASFGLDDLTENHCLYVVTLRWSNATLDGVFESLVRELMTAADTIAQEMGLYHRFKYMNYAASWQNPITSYGESSVSNLTTVSERYDPFRFFQTRVPGGFKLPLI